MSVVTYIFGIVSALLILVVVFELLRRGRLRERHAIWWIVAGILALVIGVFPSTLEWAARLIGIQVPTNLVFFVSIAILFLVALQSSAELTRLEAKTRTLAERVALLDLRIRELEGPASASQPGTAAASKTRSTATPKPATSKPATSKAATPKAAAPKAATPRAATPRAQRSPRDTAR